MSEEYNGHYDWNHWNVSLWILNDEGLYREALACVRSTTSEDKAAERFLEFLEEFGITETPDGAPYNHSTVREALVGLE